MAMKYKEFAELVKSQVALLSKEDKKWAA